MIAASTRRFNLMNNMLCPRKIHFLVCHLGRWTKVQLLFRLKTSVIPSNLRKPPNDHRQCVEIFMALLISLFLLLQQMRTLEYVKQKGSSGHKEYAAIAQKMNLQTKI